MTSLKPIIIISTLIYIGAALKNSDLPKYFNYDYETVFKRHPLYYYDVLSTNFVKSYAMWPVHKPEPEKDFKIGQHVYDLSGKILYNRSCEVKISTGNDTVNIDDQYLFEFFGLDKAIVGWKEGNFTKLRDAQFICEFNTIPKDIVYQIVILKLRVVNFKTCEFNDVTIEIDEPTFDSGMFIKDVNVITYEDRFDVFFRNRRLCQERRCKATYDSEAKQITSVIPFLNVDYDFLIESIKKFNSSDSYIVQATNEYDARSWIMIINSEGQPLMKHSYTQQSKIQKDFTKLEISSNFDDLTFCEQKWPDNGFVCQKYDSLGNLKFNVTVKEWKKKIKWIKIINLPDNAFLMFLAMDEYHRFTESKLFKIFANGTAVNVSDFNYLNCNYGTIVQSPKFFQKNKDEFCFFHTCDTNDVRFTEVAPEIVTGLQCYNNTNNSIIAYTIFKKKHVYMDD